MKFFDIKYRLNDGLHKQPRLKAAAALIGGLLAINAVAYGVTSLSNDYSYSLHKADHKTLTVKPHGKKTSGGGSSSGSSSSQAPAGSGGSSQPIQGGGSQFAGSSPAGGGTATSSGGYTSSPSTTTTLVGGMGGGTTTTSTSGTSGGSTSDSGGGSTCLCQTITGVIDTTQQTLTQVISPLVN